jgi:hypothetical protein
MGAAHERPEDAADLGQVERALDERHEPAQRDDEQEQPGDDGRKGNGIAAEPIRLAADRGEREQRVRRGRRGQCEAGDDDRVAAQAGGEPRRVGARLELGRDEDR